MLNSQPSDPKSDPWSRPTLPSLPTEEKELAPAPRSCPLQEDISLEKATISLRSVSRELSSAEVDSKMEKQGFPELKRHWEIAKRLGFGEHPPDHEIIEHHRDAHMQPLGKHPVANAIATLGAGIAGAYAFMVGFGDMLAPAAKPVAAALAVLNVSFLTHYTATTIRRYLLHPMERLMAEDTAFMLSKQDFRSWHDSTAQTQKVMSSLASHGVKNWDDSSYRVAYIPDASGWKEIHIPSPEEFIHNVLRDFLGYKDNEKRRFFEGRFTSHLLKGKSTVTEFLQSHGDLIRRSAVGDLPISDGIKLLKSLQEKIKPESDGHRIIKDAIDRAARGEFLPPGAIRAEIWARDPWRDLTHQEEFFSSASLRGVKLMGRGPKGRIGTFGYLRNKAISALDLSNKKGRVVRARIAAITAPDSSGKEVAGLYVDGVEGSNAIKPDIERIAIESYARHCGFRFVLYNSFVHNQIPRRFVNYLAEQNLEPRELSITYIESPQREYLDAFGLPLEPYEYARPQGTVIGVLKSLDSSSIPQSRAPSLLQKVLHSAKRNTLWFLVGETSASATAMVWLSEPTWLIPLFLVGAAGLGLHISYQNKSLKQANKLTP